MTSIDNTPQFSTKELINQKQAEANRFVIYNGLPYDQVKKQLITPVDALTTEDQKFYTRKGFKISSFIIEAGTLVTAYMLTPTWYLVKFTGIKGYVQMNVATPEALPLMF